MTFSLLILISIAAIGTFFFMKSERFGALPTGERLKRIQKSPHYKNGKFNNLSFTPQLAEDTNMLKVLYRFIFDTTSNTKPNKTFNFKKSDIKNLPINEDVYIWMGHSSYYLQIDGKRILVDPVFSGSSSPISFTSKAFQGTDLYNPDDFNEIDYLVITHDHWDHLDHKTVVELEPKVKHVVTSLGTGAHLERWNYPSQKITELDWFEKKNFSNGFTFNAEPARHFSGRGLKRDQALWASFVLQTPHKTIYIGGDSGYDTHFKEIGQKYSIDYAILENGQYNKDWRYIHLLPGEQDQAMKDLNARNLIPVHNSKFKLAIHPWKEPLDQILVNKKSNYELWTPQIGEKISLNSSENHTTNWWKNLN